MRKQKYQNFSKPVEMPTVNLQGLEEREFRLMDEEICYESITSNEPNSPRSILDFTFNVLKKRKIESQYISLDANDDGINYRSNSGDSHIYFKVSEIEFKYNEDDDQYVRRSQDQAIMSIGSRWIFEPSKEKKPAPKRKPAKKRKRALTKKRKAPAKKVTIVLDKPEKKVGLVNLGNTCYLNSVIQILYNFLQFREFILGINLSDDHPVESNGTSGFLFLELKAIFEELLDAEDSPRARPIIPTSFIQALSRTFPKFSGNSQHDAHELLRSLLDKICEEFIETKHAEKMKELFEGSLASEIICKNCSHTVSHIIEPFFDISLDIASPDVESIDLIACLEKYIASEKLNDVELSCPSCSSTADLYKTLSIENLPCVICLHLKRFRWDPPIKVKVNINVNVPSEIDFAKFTTQPESPRLYRLMGYITHHGNRSGSGHYTTNWQVKNEWHNFDDRKVTAVPSEKLSTQRAYILFYVRMDSLARL